MAERMEAMTTRTNEECKALAQKAAGLLFPHDKERAERETKALADRLLRETDPFFYQLIQALLTKEEPDIRALAGYEGASAARENLMDGRYDLVLMEKDTGKGLTMEESARLSSILGTPAFLPVSYQGKDKAAVGFLRPNALFTYQNYSQFDGTFIEDLLSGGREPFDGRNGYLWRKLSVYFEREA